MSSFEPLTPDEAAAARAKPRTGDRNQLRVSSLPHAWIDWRPWENVPPRSGFWLPVTYEDDITGAHLTVRDTTFAHLWLRVDSNRYLRIRADWSPDGEVSARLEAHGLDPAPLDQVQAIVKAWETFIAPEEPGQPTQYTSTRRGRPPSDPWQHIEALRQAFHRIYNPKLPAATHSHPRLLNEAGFHIKVRASEVQFSAAGTTLREQKRAWKAEHQTQKHAVN